MPAQGRAVLTYVFSLLFGYPLYFLVANTIDSLFGNGRLSLWLLFGSRSELLEIFSRDWAHSLPVMAAVLIGLVPPVHALLFRFGGVVSVLMCVFFPGRPESTRPSQMTGWKAFRPRLLRDRTMQPVTDSAGAKSPRRGATPSTIWRPTSGRWRRKTWPSGHLQTSRLVPESRIHCLFVVQESNETGLHPDAGIGEVPVCRCAGGRVTANRLRWSIRRAQEHIAVVDNYSQIQYINQAGRLTRLG